MSKCRVGFLFPSSGVFFIRILLRHGCWTRSARMNAEPSLFSCNVPEAAINPFATHHNSSSHTLTLFCYSGKKQVVNAHDWGLWFGIKKKTNPQEQRAQCGRVSAGFWVPLSSGTEKLAFQNQLEGQCLFSISGHHPGGHTLFWWGQVEPATLPPGHQCFQTVTQN